LTVGVAELYKTGRNLTVSGRLSDEELHAKYMESTIRNGPDI